MSEKRNISQKMEKSSNNTNNKARKRKFDGSNEIQTYKSDKCGGKSNGKTVNKQNNASCI
jgi:hypothetical protein